MLQIKFNYIINIKLIKIIILIKPKLITKVVAKVIESDFKLCLLIDLYWCMNYFKKVNIINYVQLILLKLAEFLK